MQNVLIKYDVTIGLKYIFEIKDHLTEFSYETENVILLILKYITPHHVYRIGLARRDTGRLPGGSVSVRVAAEGVVFKFYNKSSSVNVILWLGI